MQGMKGKGKLMKIISKKTVKLVVLILLAVTLLGGCLQKKYSESQEEALVSSESAGKDADCRIEYENGIVFARRPYFTESDGVVTMHFNGIDWYSVRVVCREDSESYFPDEEMLAQSTNLKVFRSYENQGFAYSCLFVPYDGSDDVFLFETDSSPEAMNFGFGFMDYIHYYAGGKEVFPDRELSIHSG